MKKKIVFLFIIIGIIMITPNIYAKYIIEYTNTVAKINVDMILPKIELISIKNTNTSYENYANRTHTITAKIKVEENHIKENNFNKNHIKILVNNKENTPNGYEIKELSRQNNIIYYQIQLNGILGDGDLKIKIPQGTIIDESDNENKEKIINTNIIIDNIPPVANFKEQESNDGKIIATVNSNEKLRPVNAWNLSEDKQVLTKEFENNVTYPLPVVDFAQNTSEADINVKSATNIKIRYGALGDYGADWNRWSYGQGNNEILGKEMIAKNPIYKTEVLSLDVRGNIDEDFIQMQCYMHTYWGEGSKALSEAYELIYKHGYNPTQDSFTSLKKGSIAFIDGRKTLIVGGRGTNTYNKSSLGGTMNPIPKEIAKQCLYGLSALNIKLKDTSYYSIIYQIYLDKYGWQKVASDGVETTYQHDKPISCYRVSLIPKTERQYLIDLWNKDVGTNNMK